MKCFACLPHAHDDPYPNEEVRVMGATQRSDLVLPRTREAGRMTRMSISSVRHSRCLGQVKGEGAEDITVPVGFITDLTSVPPIFRLFVSRAGPWLEAAVTHDYLYIAWQLVEGPVPRDWDRKFADDLMYAVMRVAKVSAWRRWAIYLALRVGGRWTYQRNGEGAANFGDVTDPRLEHLAAIPSSGGAQMV